MTDRVNGFTVCLDRHIRIDDAAEIINAIKMVKGVLEVKPLVSDHVDWFAEEKAKRELRQKLWDILK